MRILFTLLFLFLFCAFTSPEFPGFEGSMRSVAEIPLPQGFERAELKNGSFAEYLRKLPLRKDKTVYLYNGHVKTNQALHYAVIDVSTGNKDLQQCADAVMRLRAEYFLSKKMYDSIRFAKNGHSFYHFSTYLKNNTADIRQIFSKFMEAVFINCGSYTLEQSLQPIKDFSTIKPGDVLVKGGAPGHAEIVIDVAINKTNGKKIYLLAEGYMPAQDIHIVLNPSQLSLGPWYEVSNDKRVITPTWIFERSQLRRW